MLVCPALVVPAAAATEDDIYDQLVSLRQDIQYWCQDIYDNITTNYQKIVAGINTLREFLDVLIKQQLGHKLDNINQNITNNVAPWLVVIGNKVRDFYPNFNTYLIDMRSYLYAIKDTVLSLLQGEEGAADDFNDQVATDATEFEENMEVIQDVTRPTIEDIDLDVDKEIPEGEVVKVGQLLGIFFRNQYIYIVFFIAFTFSLVSYGIFGKR